MMEVNDGIVFVIARIKRRDFSFFSKVFTSRLLSPRANDIVLKLNEVKSYSNDKNMSVVK